MVCDWWDAFDGVRGIHTQQGFGPHWPSEVLRERVVCVCLCEGGMGH